MKFILKKYLMLPALVLTFVFMTEVSCAQVETRYEGSLPADVKTQLSNCKSGDDWTNNYIGHDEASWVLQCSNGKSWVDSRNDLKIKNRNE